MSRVQQQLFYSPPTPQNVPSLIRWTGSKRSQAGVIARHAPQHDRYLEPFLGGGALLYVLGGVGSVAGDVYDPLVKFWKTVQSDPQRVIDHYTDEWHALQDDLPGHYYVVRERFNQTRDPLDLAFLTRTCVNGIVRFNQDGEFNNSFHLSRRGMSPDKFSGIVRIWNIAIRGVEFVCEDYEDTVALAKPGDFVYLDPPYANNKSRYISDLDPDRLWDVLDDLNHRDVKWALSFDGTRGDSDFTQPVPPSLYRHRHLISSGNSKVRQVLGGVNEEVRESLYLNY